MEKEMLDMTAVLTSNYGKGNLSDEIKLESSV